MEASTRIMAVRFVTEDENEKLPGGAATANEKEEVKPTKKANLTLLANRLYPKHAVGYVLTELEWTRQKGFEHSPLYASFVLSFLLPVW